MPPVRRGSHGKGVRPRHTVRALTRFEIANRSCRAHLVVTHLVSERAVRER
ncbi:hypothetical protein MOQ72_22560 [Saccharopolyspora sp. K220]|uniref:hypothetical protein n=1 Tax=Saccharopolyspora soli TaxID=2926618 RepID=UPI001F56C46A|nr:hypothetical protein [Saccharopolyspora soli]MCI2420230.1 hypothetical protein [Saccharopolyspora soli]